MAQNNGFTFKNNLLQQLKPLDQSYLRSIMHGRVLVQDEILHDFDSPLSHVYFIETGMAAVIARLDGHREVQVALTGQEGVIGAWLLLDSDGIFGERIFVQKSGYAWRVTASDFLSACRRSPDLQEVCARWLQADVAQAFRSAACNAIHGMESRFAKWILSADDRAVDGILSLTHRSLAIMVGAHRTRVTAVAKRLQDAGCIRYSRGRISVRDRNELEARACSCYAANRGIVSRMLEEQVVAPSIVHRVQHSLA